MHTMLDEYQKGCARTMNLELSEQDAILNYVLGMAGEMGELASLGDAHAEKRFMELGDCFWYAAALAKTLGVPFSAISYATPHYTYSSKVLTTVKDVIHRGLVLACVTLDELKKVRFHKAPYSPETLRTFLDEYVQVLFSVAYIFGYKVPDILAANIVKLRVRYPSNFNADDSLNRDDARESAIVNHASYRLTEPASKTEDLSGLALQLALQACYRRYGNDSAPDDALVIEIARVIQEVMSRPWLGMATTGELLTELRVRAEVGGYLEYKTVGGV